MSILYTCIIILSVLLILSIFTKAQFYFRYEIIDMDIIKSYIHLSIFNIRIYEKEIKKTVNSFIVEYINSLMYKKNAEDKESSKTILKHILKELSKEKVNISAELGIKDSILPSFILPTLSTIFSSYILCNVKQKYIKNIHYTINSSCTHTYILINISIKFKLIILIKVFRLKNKYKEEKYGKSSNRKSND